MTSLISYTTELRTVNVKTCEPTTYKEMCENFNCYEIIPDDRKVKPYFDIEIKPEYCVEGEEYNDVFKEVCEIAYKQIQKHFKNPEIAILNASSENYVCCSNGKTKWIISGHLVIHNYKISKKKCLSIVNQMNKELAKKNEINDYLQLKDGFNLFDDGVYDPNRKIRSAFANKTHYDKTTNKVIVEDRPMVLEHGTFENSVISDFFDENFTEVEDDTEFKPISSSPTSITQFPNMSDIDYLLNICIQNNMCCDGKHKEWVIIGTALKNELGDEAVVPFVNWTNAFGTENKKNEAFIKITKEIKREKDTKNNKSVKIGTIHYWAKHYNSAKYTERFGNKADLILDNDIETALETGTDYALATYFNTKWGSNYKCSDVIRREYYGFTDKKLWEGFKAGSKIREVISNEMTKNFKDYSLSIQKYMTNNSCLEEESKVNIQKKIKLIGEIAIKFGKTTDKDHIVRELSDIIEDTEFEKKLNRLEYVLPIKGGKILNLQTLKPENRTITDNFSYECNAKYIDLTEEQETDIDTYLNELFCNNQETKKCVVNIIKSIFIGKPLRYIYFWTGSGSNGKSLFLKLINSIFGKFMDTIDTNVILDVKMTSSLTTQFEKLDKCRVGYVTELTKDDTLNKKVIKKITGGDAIDFRGLFKGNTTINPTCNLIAVTNELPNFDVDEATVNRLIVIPFNNVFKIDMTFETKMMGKLDILFSYIMKKGVICDKFVFSEEMLFCKNNYVEDNVKEDELEAFIKEFIIVGETEKDCDNKPVYIKNTAFYEKFVSNNPKSRLTKNKITKEIKKFKIETKESNGSTTYRNCRWRTDDDNVEE